MCVWRTRNRCVIGHIEQEDQVAKAKQSRTVYTAARRAQVLAAAKRGALRIERAIKSLT